MASLRFALSLLLCLVSLSAGKMLNVSVPECKGDANFRVTFYNMLTPEQFGSKIPSAGLVFSPLAGVSHNNRRSFLTVRGYASTAVETIAETGSNEKFLQRANTLRERGEGVLSFEGGSGPVLPGESGTVMLTVDCENTLVTALSMIAPSPDWIVQVNNVNLFDKTTGQFVKLLEGDLIAYDAGTDDGGDFTPPLDLSLDMPTEPRDNIVPLVEDDTDPFHGAVVGRYVIARDIQ